MSWLYWLSGLTAAALFVYLLVALFKPEVLMTAQYIGLLVLYLAVLLALAPFLGRYIRIAMEDGQSR